MEPLAGLRQAAALRQGALALYGACSPAEVTAAAAAAAACSTPCHTFQTRQVAYQFILEIKTEQLPACLASVGTARFCSRPGISGGRWQHVLAGIALTCACLLWVRHSTAQHSTAQHSTAQHSTAQHSTAQHSTAQHSTAQHSTAQHSTAQHSTAQHSTAQHSIQLCMLLHWAWLSAAVTLCVLVAGAAHTCSPCRRCRRNAASCTS